MKTLMGGAAAVAMILTSHAADTAARLPAAPMGIGRAATDRAWWDQLAATPEGGTAMKRARDWLAKPMPAFDRERYLDFVTNGDRERYQTINTARWERFKCLVLGECLEAKGRFIPAIEETVASLCSDPSWILPAHDYGAAVIKGAPPYADLGVAMNGCQMAMASWLLADRLPPATLALMRANVSKRLTGPVLATIDGTAPKSVISGHWWARANHNWNAVCTAGALGAILATEPSVQTRAKAVDWAVANMKVFLSGFGPDGYCSEGVGYWNYGFSHFVFLAEMVRSQTGGAIDPLAAEPVRRIAAAPSMLEIADGVYPAYADCTLNARPDTLLCDLIRWRISKRPFTTGPAAALAANPLLYLAMMDLTARDGAPCGVPDATASSPRSWFPDSGVCVVRPSRPGGLAASWKGGHNAEHHNHNDVGTTVVVWKGRAVIADPGAMTYRSITFGKDRYRLPVMGSYGHSVPVAAGMLQKEGRSSAARVLHTSFSDSMDTVTMDLSSAYPDAGLKQLERQWTYRREEQGLLVIEDRFAFHSPSTFSGALVGFGSWQLVKSSPTAARFLIDGGKGAILQVDAEFPSPATWEVRKLQNPGKPVAHRLGLHLSEPTAAGFIRWTIRPAASPNPEATRLPITEAPEKLEDARKAPPLPKA